MPKSTRAILNGLQDKRSKAKALVDKLSPSVPESVHEAPRHEEAPQIEGHDKERDERGTANLLAHHAKSKDVDLTEVKSLTIEKHVSNARYKVAYMVDKLADELMRECSKKSKRDKEYLKGLVWSFGTLYDKLANVDSGQTRVALPTELLRSLTDVMKAQAEALKANNVRSAPECSSPQVREPIDVTPTVQDTTSHYVDTNDIHSSPIRSTTDEKTTYVATRGEA